VNVYQLKSKTKVLIYDLCKASALECHEIGHLKSIRESVWPWLSCHDSKWLLALNQGLGHQVSLIVAFDQYDQVIGFLPLAMVQSFLFGRFLVSLPYLNSGGVCSDDPQVAHALIDRAVELADTLDVKHLELRHETPVEHPKLTVSRTDKVHMRLALPESPEALMKSYKSKLRSQIKKTSENPFELAFGSLELVDEFYHVFATNMRDLGTPVYSKRLFGAVLANFGQQVAELAVVRLEGKTIAGALLIHQDGTSQVPSASALRAYNSTGANLWMYSKLLERAILKGSSVFDFGRSSLESGTFKFKEQWGAKACPAVWQYYVRKGNPADMRPDSQNKQKLIKTWQKLPLWLSKMLGPGIVRGIP
jgi:FemAB-related protein (PEP-CTERM system-associated)